MSVSASQQTYYLNIAFDYDSQFIGNSLVVHADCFEWLSRVPENTFHAIVTDPPYGVKEYDFDQIEKRAQGNGGVWRIPPSFDGHTRQPLPRFTALNRRERQQIYDFFVNWSKVAIQALRPGGHVFLATNTFLSQLVFSAIIEGGLEFRGEIIRLVRTLRGGDRPKNAESEFPNVSSLPRASYEPWGLFRKPLPRGMKISDCLREYQTGGLRRTSDDKPFNDVIQCGRTSSREKDMAKHPTLKPQSFLRKIIHASLPLGVGLIADPFMGSGSTIAAAEALGIQSIGVERYADFYEMSKTSIPQLKSIRVPQEALEEPMLFQ
jgi:site-specific DNA-methyltransferase (adenine-specific)